MLTLSALFACVLLPQTVVFAEKGYGDFANWLVAPVDTDENNGTSSLLDVCTNNVNANAPGFNPADKCKNAWAVGSVGVWDNMCDALGPNHLCPYTNEPDQPTKYENEISAISDCCLNTCPVLTTGADKKYDTNDECCVACAGPTAEMPTTPPTTTTAKPAETTVKTGETTTAPAPTTTPGPTEDTTTMEPSTTEGGSDSDSAINIRASGLLITLITMMAAGVNIA